MASDNNENKVVENNMNYDIEIIGAVFIAIGICMYIFIIIPSIKRTNQDLSTITKIESTIVKKLIATGSVTIGNIKQYKTIYNYHNLISITLSNGSSTSIIKDTTDYPFTHSKDVSGNYLPYLVEYDPNDLSNIAEYTNSTYDTTLLIICIIIIILGFILLINKIFIFLFSNILKGQEKQNQPENTETTVTTAT